MEARVQYNHYKGTVAADEADFMSLNDFLANNGVDMKKYDCKGVNFYIGESGKIFFNFLCSDIESSEGSLKSIRFEKEISFLEFAQLFKRFDVIITNEPETFKNVEIDPNTIMIDNR